MDVAVRHNASRRSGASWSSWADDLNFGGTLFADVEDSFQGIQDEKAERRRHWLARRGQLG